MEDDLLRVKLEKLLVEAEDCDLIDQLATDPQKRERFKRLATDLRGMARDIEAKIAGRARPPRLAASFIAARLHSSCVIASQPLCANSGAG
jgi:hypothetical protein